MHRLRLALLASLVLAMEGYLGIVAYACPDPQCLEDGYWMLWGLWIGSSLALTAKCRSTRVASTTGGMLAAGYGVLLAGAALALGYPPIAVTTAAVVALLVLATNWGDCNSLLLGVALQIYDAGITLLAGINPEVLAVIPVSVLTGFTITLIHADAYLLASIAGRTAWPVAAALGLVLLAVDGFYAAYVAQAYRLASGSALSTNCTWSIYCVHTGASEIPVASTAYSLLYMLQLALTGTILSLPLPRKR